VDKRRHKRISKFLSYVLRHQPDSIGIELDMVDFRVHHHVHKRALLTHHRQIHLNRANSIEVRYVPDDGKLPQDRDALAGQADSL